MMPTFHYRYYAKLTASAALVWLLYRICRRILIRLRDRKLAKKWHCEPAKKYPAWDPILGIDFLRTYAKVHKDHKMLQWTLETYNRLMVNTMTFRLFGMPVVSTREPENVKAMLAVNFDHYGVAPLRKILVTFLDRGIFVVDGPTWQHSRSVLRPIFARSQLTDFSILKTHADRLLARIPFDGSTVDLQPLFFDLTLDVASHVLFGESTNIQLSDVRPEFVERYNRIIHFFETGGDVEFLGINWPTLGGRRFKKDCKFVKDYIGSIIEQTAVRGDYKKTDPERYILVDSLLAQGLPPDQVRAEVISAIFAGRDTTASMLSDLWFELSKHPQVFAKLQSEIRSQIDPGQQLDYDTIKNLAYLKATLNEILRIHPVVPEDGRIATCDTMLPLGGGPDEKSPVFVPKGTIVAYAMYSMHRRKDIWGEDADLFRPERWIDHVNEDGEEVKGVRPGWAYTPFNGGPRICIGQQFALLQASYVTIRLLQSISSLESRDPEPWIEKIGLTATGLNGCKVAMRANT